MANIGEPGRVLGLSALDDRVAMLNFTEALGIAESAAKQLAFYQERPEWLIIQTQLNRLRQTALVLARSQTKFIT